MIDVKIDTTEIGIILLVVIIGIFLLFMFSKHVSSSVDSFVVVSSVLCVCLLLGFCLTEFHDMRETKTAVADAEERGYKVFLDGKKVDWDSIDISMYDVKVNPEKKSVCCTAKTKRR